MILILLATGSIRSEPEPVTPELRVIRVLRAGNIVTAQQPLDPSDVLDFVLDLTPLLETGERFASIELVVTATSGLVGFLVLDDAPFERKLLTNSTLRVWVTIDVDKRALPQWSKGTPCSFELTGITNMRRTWQRTVQIVVGNR